MGSTAGRRAAGGFATDFALGLPPDFASILAGGGDFDCFSRAPALERAGGAPRPMMASRRPASQSLRSRPPGKALSAAGNCVRP